MDRKIKLLAIDLDGTLLDDDYQCDLATRELLLRLQNEGVHVVFCTGRALEPTKKLAADLGMGSYLVSDNGAVVYHIPTKSAILIREISPQSLNGIMEILEGTGAHIDATSLRTMYTVPHSEEIAEMYKKYMANPIVLERIRDLSDPILKVTLFAVPEQITKIINSLPDKLQAYPVKCFQSGPTFIDVMHEESTKGNTLHYLSHQLGISPQQVMAIGNYYNDMDMIQFAGVGVAMENAPEDVKKIANFVTSSNNNQGVKKAIETFMTH